MARSVLKRAVSKGQLVRHFKHIDHSRHFPALGRCLALALLVMAPPGLAQTVTDGDTIKHDGQTYRLWGIDAPETKQRCADGWEAGKEATKAIADLIRGRRVECFDVALDRYGRTVALCFADDVDLSAEMVRTGMAWAFARYSRDYVGQEAEARAAGLGVHAHGCEPAWEYRARGRTSR